MSSPLRVVVLGLDERAQNLFRMFFRGPCQNQAAIVDHEKDADAFLIDLDTQHGAKLLAQQRDSHPERLLIVLSVQDQAEVQGIVFVKKPAQAQSMIAAIDKARALAKAAAKEKPSLFGWAMRKSSSAAKAEAPPPKKPPPAATENKPRINTERKPAPPPPPTRASSAPPARPAGTAAAAVPPGMKVVARPDKEETAAHRVAMLLDEQGFKSYLGHRDDIDPSDPEQLASALYDPKLFLQSHIQSAIKVAHTRNEPIRLETPWKNITILPQQGLVHILADEAQLRAACGIPFRSIVGMDVDAVFLQQAINIKPVSQQELEEVLGSKDLTRLDAFMWKVALYTSKGRLPRGMDFNKGVYLTRWPCMTRLLLPPHAMRISALLTQKPHSLFEAARRMGIRQQYLFAFVSAAHAVGLIGQKALPVEAETAPETAKPDKIAQPERQSLFRKILSRLKLI